MEKQTKEEQSIDDFSRFQKSYLKPQLEQQRQIGNEQWTMRNNKNISFRFINIKKNKTINLLKNVYERDILTVQKSNNEGLCNVICLNKIVF